MEAKLLDWWETYMTGNKRPAPTNGNDALLLYPEANDGKIVEASRRRHSLLQRACKSTSEDRLTAIREGHRRDGLTGRNCAADAKSGHYLPCHTDDRCYSGIPASGHGDSCADDYKLARNLLLVPDFIQHFQRDDDPLYVDAGKIHLT
jgi:hypothetical protein